MGKYITIRIWDDNHKELVSDDAIEFNAEGDQLGCRNVKYYPETKIKEMLGVIDLLSEGLRFYEPIYGNWEESETIKGTRFFNVIADTDLVKAPVTATYHGGKKARSILNNETVKKYLNKME